MRECGGIVAWEGARGKREAGETGLDDEDGGSGGLYRGRWRWALGTL
jgi:hypothetical protein